MTNELSVDVKTGELTSWTPDQLQLIKDTVAKGCTDDELKLFLYTAMRTGLDPLLKQIHMIKRWDSTLNRMAATIQTGIDGYRVVAERSGTYAGQDAPVFEWTDKSTGMPFSATVTVYKVINGLRVGYSATAYYREYVQTKKGGEPNSMWAKMPASQLAKCAEALALRKAFPHDLSAVYTFEEMAQATNDVPQIPKTTEPHTDEPAPREDEIISWARGKTKDQIVTAVTKRLDEHFKTLTVQEEFMRRELELGVIKDRILGKNTIGELLQLARDLKTYANGNGNGAPVEFGNENEGLPFPADEEGQK